MIQPLFIQKRMPNVVDVFDVNKIRNSINAARKDSLEFEENELDLLVNKVMYTIERLGKYDELTVDDIKEIVFGVLVDNKKVVTAETYLMGYPGLRF